MILEMEQGESTPDSLSLNEPLGEAPLGSLVVPFEHLDNTPHFDESRHCPPGLAAPMIKSECSPVDPISQTDAKSHLRPGITRGWPMGFIGA